MCRSLSESARRMENSVNETEKLLSSRLADWPGCLEGRERGWESQSDEEG